MADPGRWPDLWRKSKLVKLGPKVKQFDPNQTGWVDTSGRSRR